ncbi:MAG: DNA-binding protein [Nitrososphaerota archaeon]|nr:DNA-binding protein [Nitrososphaerales archaeon]MDW8044596.1 DNA-binding protein [Nitrososphaerota archaeon]
MAEDYEKELAASLQERKKQLIRLNLLRIALTPEARQRLTNVKMVRPDVATMIENHIIQLVTSGKLQRPITDDELKQILASLQQPKREFKIRWA